MTVTVLAVAAAACVVSALVPWMASGHRARLTSMGRRPAEVVRAQEAAVAVDVPDLLVLLDVAIASGVSLPRALAAVGRAVGGQDGRALARVSAALVLGAGWEVAWASTPGRLAPVADCLVATWTTGSAPRPALRAAAETLARERRTVAREAAGRLGVRLVLPLGLCFLPAFVLVGLVPVLVSVGSQVVR